MTMVPGVADAEGAAGVNDGPTPVALTGAVVRAQCKEGSTGDDERCNHGRGNEWRPMLHARREVLPIGGTGGSQRHIVEDTVT